MSLSLHTIGPAKGSKKASKRVGRGLAKGGTYSGRGSKGQRARSGGKAGLKLRGLRNIMLSMPKSRGFKSIASPMAVVNVGDLALAFPDGTTITPKMIVKRGLIRSAEHGVKVLGAGEIGIKLTLKELAVSASAKEKIEKAGGTVA